MSIVYDYRVSREALNHVGAKVDKLSDQKLLKLSEIIDDMQKVQFEEQTAKAKEYFKTAILSGLKAFAEISESSLYVEEYDERMSVQAVFKNEMGFDLKED